MRGAPISDDRSGHIVGVIDLTSFAADASALMLPLATRAAREIEQRLVDATGFSERLVLQRFLQERLRANGPLIFLTERTMITNAAADRLIEGDASLSCGLRETPAQRARGGSLGGRAEQRHRRVCSLGATP